ncbi:MAG: ribonuclease III [Candidatus Kapabacteria bacterium]|nr:ribonuclease III [Candidatus Kapabacteria bacterium]
MKDIVRQLYANLLKLTSGRSRTAAFKELFPPMDILSPESVAQLEQHLGVSIKTVSLFEQALTHRSYLQVVNSPDQHSNERLEFLGDAILGMITAEYLFYNNKNVLEGELTKMRSWLVNKKSLAICARAMHLEEHLLISYSAKQSLQRGNDSMLADALEALIAAVYLDQGFDAVRRFIIDKMLPIMVQESLVHDTNYKSLLLETVQARGQSAPRYVVIAEEGPDHEKLFTVEVWVDDRCVGTGKGRNKKDAEQQAAETGMQAYMRRQSPRTQPEDSREEGERPARRPRRQSR